MNRQILKKPQVEQDLVECFAFIARDKIEPAERFLRVAEESFRFLAANPFAGQRWDSPHADLVGIRVYTLADAVPKLPRLLSTNRLWSRNPDRPSRLARFDDVDRAAGGPRVI